jgi:hypothetical protein
MAVQGAEAGHPHGVERALGAEDLAHRAQRLARLAGRDILSDELAPAAIAHGHDEARPSSLDRAERSRGSFSLRR